MQMLNKINVFIFFSNRYFFVVVSMDALLASFFFGARIWLGKIVGRFSINYFSGLGLRIRVRVWVRVGVGVGVRVSVVIWSG